MASSPTMAGTPSNSLLETPLSSPVSQSSSWRSFSSKFSSELSRKLDPNLRRRIFHENSDFSADESDVPACEGKQKDESPSPNNGTQAVRGFSPWNSSFSNWISSILSLYRQGWPVAMNSSPRFRRLQSTTGRCPTRSQPNTTEVSWRIGKMS